MKAEWVWPSLGFIAIPSFPESKGREYIHSPVADTASCPPTSMFSICLTNETLCSAKESYFPLPSRPWDYVTAKETVAERTPVHHSLSSLLLFYYGRSTLPTHWLWACSRVDGMGEEEALRGFCDSAHSSWTPDLRLRRDFPWQLLLPPGSWNDRLENRSESHLAADPDPCVRNK